MKDYVVFKCNFTASNRVWVTKLTPYDEVFMYADETKAEQKVRELRSEETGSVRLRIYKWEYIEDFEKKEKDKKKEKNN